MPHNIPHKNEDQPADRTQAMRDLQEALMAIAREIDAQHIHAFAYVLLLDTGQSVTGRFGVTLDPALLGVLTHLIRLIDDDICALPTTPWPTPQEK